MLEAAGLTRRVDGRTLFADLELSLTAGETLLVRGRSGSGKSQLLRCLAWLLPVQGRLRLHGESPKEMGAPRWRSELAYVPQQVPGLLGTPREHHQALCAFAVQRDRAGTDPVRIAEEWGLAESAWDQEWSELSGGEQQRAMLASVLSRGPTVLLLDEPTSAMDPDAVAAVEASLATTSAIWVTHDPLQAERVGTRELVLA